ncbi:MAG: hypothetical protein U5N85_07995 [Arcicella sp.]|nr:hypothetical protein [Arcicella sp.]
MSARNIDGSVTFSGYAGDDGNGNISGTTKGDISITVTTTNDKEKGKNHNDSI